MSKPDSSACWYVIRTLPQSEKKAVAELRRIGLRVYLPKRYIETIHRRTKQPLVKRRPLFIGYVLGRFPDKMSDNRGVPHFGVVRDCQGVMGFLRALNDYGEWEPFPIPAQAVGEYMRRQRRREFGRPSATTRAERMAGLRDVYRPGRVVRVAGGPFAGFLAVLEKLNENETITAEVSIFGRPTKISLGIEGVRTLAKSAAAA